MPKTAALLPAENASVAWKNQLEAIHRIGYLPKWRDIAGYCKLLSETEPRLAECPKNAVSGDGETGCPPEPLRRPHRRRDPCREPYGRTLRQNRIVCAISIIAKCPKTVFAIMGICAAHRKILFDGAQHPHRRIVCYRILTPKGHASMSRTIRKARNEILGR